MKWIVGIVLCSSFFGFTQEEMLLKSEIQQNTVSVETNKGTYTIQYYSSGALETSFLANNETNLQPSHAIIATPLNESIVQERGKQSGALVYRMAQSENAISFSLDSVPFKIHYFYQNEPLVHQNALVDGENGYELTMGISENEALYGGGVRALGMNRRGNKLELYNRAHYGYETHAPLMNYCIPMFLSSNGYAVHFDAPGTGWLDLDSAGVNEVTYSTVSARKSYQVVTGENWGEILQNWTLLSGRQPKLPIWALGNFASRFGYHSQQEVEELVAKFKEDSIPLDAVVLDLYWFGETIKGTMGNLAFYADSFPDPKGMIDQLHDQQIKTVLVTEPFILTSSNRWEEALENDVLAKDSSGKVVTYDFYFGNTGLIDVFDPKAGNWFWNRYRELKEMGVDGFWGDLGEPEVHPDEILHATGTAREVHNIFGHKWAQLLYENLKRSYPNEQPFILMRSGSSGSQRFGMIPWSGDVNRTWGGLRSQPEIALQMGMQGVPFMHSDLGGFAGANDDPELYVRWLQYGVFQPIFRPHAQEEVASEPVFKDAATKQLAKEAIELRYRMLPYNYTLMCEASKTGMPLMRPVFFESRPEDGKTFALVDSTYFWGDAFLISPVLVKGQQQKEVNLPDGFNWFDFYSGNFWKGGQTAELELSMNHIPTFVRGESFVPMVEGLQNTAEYQPSETVIHYYVDPTSGSGTGAFEYDHSTTGTDKIDFKSNWKKRKGEMIATSEMGQTESLNLTIHLWSSEIRKLKVNGKKMKIKKLARDIELMDLPFDGNELKIEMKVKAAQK